MRLTASVSIFSSSVDRRAVCDVRVAGHGGCRSFPCWIRIESQKWVSATESGRLIAISDSRGASGNLSCPPAGTRPRGPTLCRTQDAGLFSRPK